MAYSQAFPVAAALAVVAGLFLVNAFLLLVAPGKASLLLAAAACVAIAAACAVIVIRRSIPRALERGVDLSSLE